MTNLEVAKLLVKSVNPEMADAEVAKNITHVEDRAFNDVRYYIDSTKLQSLGWKCAPLIIWSASHCPPVTSSLMMTC